MMELSEDKELEKAKKVAKEAQEELNKLAAEANDENEGGDLILKELNKLANAAKAKDENDIAKIIGLLHALNKPEILQLKSQNNTTDTATNKGVDDILLKGIQVRFQKDAKQRHKKAKQSREKRIKELTGLEALSGSFTLNPQTYRFIGSLISTEGFKNQVSAEDIKINIDILKKAVEEAEKAAAKEAAAKEAAAKKAAAEEAEEAAKEAAAIAAVKAEQQAREAKEAANNYKISSPPLTLGTKIAKQEPSKFGEDLRTGVMEAIKGINELAKDAVEKNKDSDREKINTWLHNLKFAEKKNMKQPSDSYLLEETTYTDLVKLFNHHTKLINNELDALNPVFKDLEGMVAEVEKKEEKYNSSNPLLRLILYILGIGSYQELTQSKENLNTARNKIITKIPSGMQMAIQSDPSAPHLILLYKDYKKSQKIIIDANNENIEYAKAKAVQAKAEAKKAAEEDVAAEQSPEAGAEAKKAAEDVAAEQTSVEANAKAKEAEQQTTAKQSPPPLPTTGIIFSAKEEQEPCKPPPTQRKQ